MARKGAGPLAALLVLALALLSGCGVVANQQPTETRRAIVTADGQRLQAVEAPATGQPAVAEATARAQAIEAAPGAGQASAIRARFVSLTLETEPAARQVWLVTYAGVPFVPEGCACHGDNATANTVVAVDGQTGAVVLLFGSGDEGAGQ